MTNDQLRTLRLKKGLTQESIAFELNVSQKAYSKLERGTTCLTLSKMVELARILEVSIDTLCPIGSKCRQEKKLKTLLQFLAEQNIPIPEHLK